MLPEPPPFESEVAEVEWVIEYTLKTAARRGEAFRVCQAKHQAVSEALQECADR